MQKIVTTEQDQVYEDRPNQNAQIGFVIHYPFHFYVYKNIYKHLIKESEFIIDMGAFSVEQPPELLLEITLLLKKEKVSYRILYFDDYIYKNYLSTFFKKYKILVSVWESGCMVIQETQEIKKAHVTYGAGKELTFLRPSQSIYNLTLDYGKRSANLHAYFSHPTITGNAKFDDWFNDTLDQVEILSIQSKIDKNKKTILYLPTHGDLSSVEKITPKLIKISKKYNIIIKLHYYIAREEPERLKLLSHKNFFLYKDDYDLLLLLKVSDMVLSDNSSAIFDAILADKPILVTDYLSNDFLNREHLENKIFRRGSIGALTYSESIEQKIKKDGRILTIKNEDDFNDKITETLSDSKALKEKRKKIRNEIFDYNDGKCGERGSKAILDLLNIDTILPKPIMHHAIEAYKSNINLLSYSEKDWLEKKIKFYQEKLNDHADNDDIFFSIIAIKKDEKDPSFLQSLIKQNFPKNKFEIIIVEEKGDKKNPLLPNEIKMIINDGITLGRKITKAIEISKGNIICFTTSDVVVGNDWLLSFYATYKKDKIISGCGGYKTLKNNSYLNYFYIQEIAIKTGLGLTKGMRDIYNLFPVTNSDFSTNPVGLLSNSSYKKKNISKIFINSNSIYEIELLIKNESLKHGPLSFILSSATNRNNVTFKEFMRENIKYGFFSYTYSKKINSPQISTSFIEIIIYTLAQITKKYSIKNLSITCIIFCGHSFRYLGSLLGILYIRLTLLNIKIKDLEKQ